MINRLQIADGVDYWKKPLVAEIEGVDRLHRDDINREERLILRKEFVIAVVSLTMVSWAAHRDNDKG
jgi:hypothetical protein